MLLAAGAAMTQIPGVAQAQQSARAAVGAVRIGSNECWTGPFSEGVAAATANAVQGNRYEPDNDHARLFAAVAAVEGVPADYVLAWPGSSDPLSRSVVTFCSPDRALVTARVEADAGSAHRRLSPRRKDDAGSGSEGGSLLHLLAQ